MSKSITLFPVLNKSMKDKLGFKSSEPVFSYINASAECPLDLREKHLDNNSFFALLRDSQGRWHAENNNLLVHRHFSIEDTSALFGPKGITAAKNKLGIAIQWISSKAQQRGFVRLVEFGAEDKTVSADLHYEFPKGILKGNLQLNTVLFLSECREVDNNEQHLASDTGTVLGVLDTCEVVIDGNGSVFPIVLKNSPGELLWGVDFSSTEPDFDAFDEENVCIYLNTAHELYDEIDTETNIKDRPLLIEILTTALLVICNEAKSNMVNWDEIMSSGMGFEQGSIAEAMYYFQNKLRWDFTNQITLSKTIRSYFEKVLKG